MRARAAIWLLVFAILGTACGSKDSNDRESAPPKQADAHRSPVWHKGTSWTVKVKQNGGDVAATGSGQDYTSVYDFEVATEGTKAGSTWKVSANLADAEGLQAKGFTLYYKEISRKRFDLTGVALRNDPPQPLDFKDFVLGRDFPLEERVTATPKSRTIDQRS